MDVKRKSGHEFRHPLVKLMANCGCARVALETTGAPGLRERCVNPGLLVCFTWYDSGGWLGDFPKILEILGESGFLYF